MEATPAGDAHTRVLTRHAAAVGTPHVVIDAPGRVNLIGEHTDYNDGYVAPVALAMGTTVAASRIAGDHLRVTAAGFGNTVIDLADPMRDVPEWAQHIAGCVAACAHHGIDVAASALTIDTDLPVGAGVSSSAALEIAVLSALASLAGHEITPTAIALLAQKVENDWVGVPSGIMDPLVIAGARAGHAMVIDCADLTATHTPVNDDIAIAVLDTGTRRRLADGAYAERRHACERAAATLGVASLRAADLDAVNTLSDLVLRRRARHVVTENARVHQLMAAVADGDTATMRAVMAAGHASLRDDFEVSSPALDAMVTTAVDAPGCVGARMTGGGFAGCAVALVHREAIAAFTTAVLDGYASGDDRARVWCGPPAAGATIST